MRCGLLLAGALVVAALGSAASAADDAADMPDGKRIQGAWKQALKIEKGVETKTDDGDESQLTLRVTFEERNLKVFLGPKGAPIEIPGTYFLDPDQTPKVIDVTITGGDGGTNEVHAIYMFDNDRLQLRIRNGGGQRPIGFETPEDDCSTIVFRRIMPGE